MLVSKPDKAQPFHVVVKGDGALVKGFATMEEAEANAAERTQCGKAFACKPEYEAMAKPT